jgi:branched-chain amino acid transport system ATP-binding protein
VIQVMEGRHCFGHLTIEENLLTGAYTRISRAELKQNWKRSTLLPAPEDAAHVAGRLYLRRRAADVRHRPRLMAKPSMILLDEPSMGLAPQIVEEIFEIVKDLNSKENVSFLLAEQNTMVALRYADFGYILENGRVVMEGAAASWPTNEDVKEFYLGVSGAGRKSFRDMKFYRRRKRWLA